MERVKTFVDGGREFPADLNAIQDRAAELLEDTAAALPSSHFAGRFYRATDTKQLWIDNGTIWEPLLPSLIVKTSSSESPITAKGSEFLEMTGLSGQVRLPTGSATNTIVGVFALGGETSLQTTGGEHIIGRGEGSSETSIIISINQYVIVRYDGTHWLIVGGIPNEYVGKAQIRVESITDTKVVKGRALVKTENTWATPVERTIPPGEALEFTPNASRRTYVSFRIPSGGSSSSVTIKVDGIEVGFWGEGAGRSTVIPVNANKKVALTKGAVSPVTIFTSFLED